MPEGEASARRPSRAGGGRVAWSALVDAAVESVMTVAIAVGSVWSVATLTGFERRKSPFQVALVSAAIGLTVLAGGIMLAVIWTVHARAHHARRCRAAVHSTSVALGCGALAAAMTAVPADWYLFFEACCQPVDQMQRLAAGTCAIIGHIALAALRTRCVLHWRHAGRAAAAADGRAPVVIEVTPTTGAPAQAEAAAGAAGAAPVAARPVCPAPSEPPPPQPRAARAPPPARAGAAARAAAPPPPPGAATALAAGAASAAPPARAARESVRSLGARTASSPSHWGGSFRSGRAGSSAGARRPRRPVRLVLLELAAYWALTVGAVLTVNWGFVTCSAFLVGCASLRSWAIEWVVFALWPVAAALAVSALALGSRVGVRFDCRALACGVPGDLMVANAVAIGQLAAAGLLLAVVTANVAYGSSGAGALGTSLQLGPGIGALGCHWALALLYAREAALVRGAHGRQPPPPAREPAEEPTDADGARA